MAPRSYRSPARAAKAAETRRRILLAARELFAAQGYAAATIEAVAARAGLSVASVYQRFGNKRSLLTAQLDDIDDVAELGRMRAIVEDEAVPVRDQVAALAHFMARLGETAGGLMAIAQRSGDAEIQAMLREGLARHRAGTARLAAHWQARGALRAGLSAEEAAAVLGTICSPFIYETLRRNHGWSAAAAEHWLADAVARLVLEPSQCS